MSIRVVARIRPQNPDELGRDAVVSTDSKTGSSDRPALIKIPNPKNESEDFTFQFTSVYDASATQQQVFDNEVSPIVKHLFNGFDITIFAYGATNAGKTHTMRGGKTLAERGVIPRLLSAIYRRARKIDKESEGRTTVEIALSYYEIYNDKVFDLFEAPEKRTMAGLPLRDNGGKTVVVGLTERPCESLKDFERLYDQANINRSTSATKLNAASSRSHAILGIKLTISTESEARVSTASAIDLAGSEDNRRTENGKERMVESASINKSLFALAKCVEAISTNCSRIPYRESKMTRILSLGQNKGLTVMILNLAPTRLNHLDTLSSLNFANRTKRIEVREIENEAVFKAPPRSIPSVAGSSIQRQPLRPLASTVHNAATLHASTSGQRHNDKQIKAFHVYSDKARHSSMAARPFHGDSVRRMSPLKRPMTSDPFQSSSSRPPKTRSPKGFLSRPQATMSKEAIEDMVEKKVADILAARAFNQPSVAPQPEISEEVQRRLELLEQKIDSKNDGKEQGLTFLLMAKQHGVRGEDASALRMYDLAKNYFPDNKKLDYKITRLRQKLQERRQQPLPNGMGRSQFPSKASETTSRQESIKLKDDNEGEYQDEAPENDPDASVRRKAKKNRAGPRTVRALMAEEESESSQTPRTMQLLRIVNTRDIEQIKLLKGVGAKKAEAIVEGLCAQERDEEGETAVVHNLGQLGRLRGVGVKTVENIRSGFLSTLEMK